VIVLRHDQAQRPQTCLQRPQPTYTASYAL